MNDERCRVFIDSLDIGNTDFLNDLEKQAISDFVPIIRRPAQSLLRVLLADRNPKNILEVGTAVGFSALLMAQYTGADTHITTIEKYEKRIPIARENFAKSPFADRITLLEGDAADILAELSESRAESFDFIFMDAAKAQYINFYPYILKLLTKGGMLVSDNVLQEGDILESRYAVTRRDRTIHKRMREYLKKISNGEDYVTTILPIADGMALSVKK